MVIQEMQERCPGLVLDAHAFRGDETAVVDAARLLEAKRTHPLSVFVALHPGTVETGLAPALRAGHPSVRADVAAGNLLAVLEGLGPEASGGFYDWKGEDANGRPRKRRRVRSPCSCRSPAP